MSTSIIQLVHGTITARFVLALLLFWLSANPEAQAQNFWQQTNGPHGGFVNAFAINATGDIFAGTEGGGVFRSTNNGNSWMSINVGLTDPDVQSLVINNSGHIFAGTENSGIFRSKDNGNSWTLVNGGLTDFTVRALAINSAGRIFAGTYDGVFCSDNNGDSWMRCGNNMIPEVEALAINSAGHIFAGSYRDGVFRSTNNGNSWTRINTGLKNTSVNTIAINVSDHVFVGTDGGGVFRSTNNGDSWTQVNNGLTELVVESIAINKSGAIFAGEFRSTNNGDSWINLGLNYHVLTLIINQSGHIFAGTEGGGVFRSMNNGDSWSRVNTGVVNTAILALAINKNGHIFAGSYGDPVFRSTGNGNMWTLVDNGLSDPEVGALAINSLGHVFAGALERKIFRSEDNGASWRQLNTPTMTSVLALAINARDEIFAGTGDDIFAGTVGSGIFRSTNNGNSWAQVNTGLTKTDVRALAINKSGHIFAGTDSGGVFRSTNNGNSWTRVGLTNLSVMALAINDSGHVFAGTLVEGIFRSKDNGISWEPVNRGLAKTDIRALAINKAGVIFAGASNKYIFTGKFEGGGIFRSENNGNSWTSIESGLTNTSTLSLAINDSGYIFAGTFGGGVFRSLETTGAAPTVTTNPPTNVSTTSATLNGAVNPNGLPTMVQFEYGTTTNYGTVVTATQSPVTGTSSVAVNATLMGLTPSTTYHYRIVATNSMGTATSAGRTFTTFIFNEIAASAGVADQGDGRGVAFGDVDNDGDMDIYVSNETPVPSNHLFINNGSGQFNEATNAGVTGTSNGQGVAFGDIDNDGDLDLFVTSFDGSNKLYLNEGNNKFKNIAATARVEHRGQGRGVAFGDIDNDGDLDLYVVYQEQRNRMYRNKGNNIFEDIASMPKYGLADSASFIDQAASLGDVDNDGDLDLYVSGGVGANLLFRNNGDTTFTEIGMSANVTNDLSGQGVAFGDIDNDQDLDLYVANGAPGQNHVNRLYKNKWNEGELRFDDISSAAGVADIGFGTGVAFADVENDGDLDLFLVNTSGQQNRIFLNDGRGFFTKVDTAAGIGGATHGRGTAFGDIDKDGDLDLYVVISDGPDLLYRNEINNSNNFLIIKTIGTISNRDGIGARVRIVTGGLSQIREVNGGSGYLSQNSLPVELGLGQATKVDSIIIRWPSGKKQILTNQAVNQFLTITEPANRSPAVINAISSQTIFVGGASFIRNLNAPPIVFSDPDGDALTYSAISSDTAKAKASISGSTLTVAPVVVGSATITVTANDGRGGTVSTTFNVNVTGSAPTATTNAATNIDTTSATLNGTVNPNGVSTTVKFQYGLTTSYGSEVTATPNPVTGFSVVSVSARLMGLAPNTTYHYRLIATNSVGTTNGPDQMFMTLPPGLPPVVTTTAATNVGTTSATLHGMVNPNNLSTAVKFQYGPSTSYGSEVTATPSPINGSNLVPVSVGLSALAPGTLYHYRVVGMNSAGTTNGADQTFTTLLPAYPSTLPVSSTVSYPSRAKAADYPATDYRIVGLPGASNRSVNEFLSGAQNQNWQAFRDNGAASNFFVAFDGSANFQFSTGRAFWIINKGPLNISTTVPSAPLNNVQEIELPLPNSSWNLITNPFTTSVAWSKIQSANNVTEPIYTFTGAFSTATSFDPYSGYYFFNATNLSKLKIPYALYFTSTPAAEIDPAIWRVNIGFASGEFSDRSTSFGVTTDASSGLDRLDFRKPRALAATPTVEFKRPNWDANFSTFATDIRPEFEESESWEFDVRAISRQLAQLTFAGIGKIPSRFEVYLLDADHAQSVNLREDSLYRFTPAAELMKFKVVVGRKEKVQEQLNSLALPKEFALGPNYPNPFNRSTERSRRSPTTTIPIAVPVAAEIKLKIYNLLGAEVKAIYDGSIEAGRYWFNWDGRNELGNQVATGVYLYRLTMSKGVSLLGKMILMR